MPDLYVDDTVQDRGQFVLGAVLFGPDAEQPVSAAIESVGVSRVVLRPKVPMSAAQSMCPVSGCQRDEFFDARGAARISSALDRQVC